MLELFLSLYLQAAILLSGDTTTTTQTQSTQTTIRTQPDGPVNSRVKPTTTTIGGGGWDDKN